MRQGFFWLEKSPDKIITMTGLIFPVFALPEL